LPMYGDSWCRRDSWCVAGRAQCRGARSGV